MKLTTLIATAALASTVSGAAYADLSVTSPDLKAGAQIAPAQYWDNFGCHGENQRPEIQWQGAPEGTKGFAVTLYDQDAPTGSGFWHWVVYDIPADVSSIPGDAIPTGAIEGNTDIGQPGYVGPCPPVGRQHTYTFTVHALDTDTLAPPEGATAALTGFFIYQHTLASATLPVLAGPRSE